jgi:amino acid transporter
MAQPPGVFLRRASGLVRDWSLFDAFALQSFSQPYMAATLIFAYAPFWPNSNLILGIVLVTIMAAVQCLIYTFMVTTMPRAGADYVWQSRILHPALGFAKIFPGYLIVLPSWITIITYAFDSQFISPMLALYGNLNAAYWVLGNDGLFVTTIIVLIYTFIVCSLGLRWFARIQAVWFWLAMVGVFATIGGLWLSSPATFQAGLNSFYTNVLGYSGSNAYQDIIATAQKQGLSASLNWTGLRIFLCFRC